MWCGFGNSNIQSNPDKITQSSHHKWEPLSLPQVKWNGREKLNKYLVSWQKNEQLGPMKLMIELTDVSKAIPTMDWIISLLFLYKDGFGINPWSLNCH